ncbi:DUF2490 domain-containing protein [Spirosoma linguale]|uniref:DUF2490 domain-containing protein n=1 Tax=Spirosoma linguale TaxID=108 RepID=UPI003CC8064C
MSIVLRKFNCGTGRIYPTIAQVVHRFLLVVWVFTASTTYAQTYRDQVLNRTVFWSEVNLVYKTAGKWSFQLDHQYRRQADDNGRDLNAFRYPLLQVFRPWINYQLSPPVQVSLSPLGLWWNWGRVSPYQPLTFFQEIRITPQLQITKPLGNGQLIHRVRTELRWASRTDTLTRAYIFLSDGESQQVLADRFSLRLRTLARWMKPAFKRDPTDNRWYSQLSIEPMLVVSASGIRFDQQRTYLALGRRIQKHLRLEVGYMNQFTFQRRETDRLHLFRFNHGLHWYVYLESGR